MGFSFSSLSHPGTSPALCSSSCLGCEVGWVHRAPTGGDAAPRQPIQLHPSASLCKPACTQLPLCRTGCGPTESPLCPIAPSLLSQPCTRGCPAPSPELGVLRGNPKGQQRRRCPLPESGSLRDAGSRALLLQLRCRVSPSPCKAAPSNPAAGGALIPHPQST